jgi:hypothetical protein
MSTGSGQLLSSWEVKVHQPRNKPNGQASSNKMAEEALKITSRKMKNS